MDWPKNLNNLTRDVDYYDYKSISKGSMIGQYKATQRFYNMRTCINSTKSSYKFVFRFEDKAYVKNPYSGLYQYDSSLLTENVMREIVNQDKPEW